eukprot:1145836-Pelagomonas_calceolata.AAC.2
MTWHQPLCTAGPLAMTWGIKEREGVQLNQLPVGYASSGGSRQWHPESPCPAQPQMQQCSP